MSDVVVRGDIMSGAELIGLEAELRDCASDRYNTYAEVMRAAADAIEGLRARVTELEGRECGCNIIKVKRDDGSYKTRIVCQEKNDFVDARCTITENARLRDALEFAENALSHAAENMPHPDQMIDDAKDKARAALKETDNAE